MSKAGQSRLEKVTRYSASLRTLFTFAFAIVAASAVISALVLLLGPVDGRDVVVGHRVYSGEEITTTIRIVEAIGSLLGFAIVLMLLHHLRVLFGLYASGQIFTAENVRQIREIGVSVMLFTAVWAYDLLADILLGVGPAMPVSTAVRIGSGIGFRLPAPFTPIVAGIIIVIVSWVMDAGRELREEQDLTV